MTKLICKWVENESRSKYEIIQQWIRRKYAKENRVEKKNSIANLYSICYS